MAAYILPLTVESPWMLAGGLALVALAMAAAYWRRLAVPLASQLLAGGGMVLLALAAAGLTWLRPAASEVTVMVDLSPSTRGAAYRDAKALVRRIDQLLGDVPRRIIYFAADNRTAVAPGPTLPDLPAKETVFSPPQAPAILLFSDCRFAPAVCPPAFIVIDPGLAQPADAAVNNIELRGRQVIATVANGAAVGRELSFSNAPGQPVRIPTGELVATTQAAEGAAAISAQLSAGDLWPENDRLTVAVLPPGRTERWWVGRDDPGPPWRRFDPAALPLDASVYLAPAVIVLENLPAAALSAEHQRLLHQYVRDLGGALMILGGDQAFAAGGYPGTLLESISPLASAPPTPTTHWIILADASGSMAAAAGSFTRWDLEREAIVSLLPHLPPEDPASIGSFAKELVWWSLRKSARDTARLPLPPGNISPNGPADVETALSNLIESTDGATQNELLLLTDAEAEIKLPALLRQGFIDKRIRLHILAIGRGKALATLTDLATATGGRVVEELDAAQWPAALRRLAQGAVPDYVSSVPILVHYTQWKGMAGHPVAPWNRTWPKERRTDLWADATLGPDTIPMMAQWPVGQGTVLAAGFAPGMAEIDHIAADIGRQPRDDHYRVSSHSAGRFYITVDASEGNKPLVGANLRLDLIDPEQIWAEGDYIEAPPTAPIPQTLPGRYEISVDAGDHPTFAAVRVEQKDGDRWVWKLLDRVAIPVRYAREFDAIGNDSAAMGKLAARSGGAVIEPGDTRRLTLPWPRRDVPLGTAAALAGVVLIGAGLVRWRRA